MNYVTSDLYLTSYLKVKGFKFKMDKLKTKSNFVFEKSDELMLAVEEYLNENGSCNPLVFANAIKNVKNLLYNS
jgi:hypothetical protein